jgi:hypothetical protein
MKVLLAVTLSTLLFTSVSCFTSTTVPNTSFLQSKSVLNLVPKQGCQLAAASAAALAKKKQEKSDDAFVTEKFENAKHLSPTDATREFAARLFHLPLSFGGKKGSQEAVDFKIPGIQESMKDNDNNNDRDDVVLFPIVGFQYVKLQDGTVRGIPTVHATPEKAVCNLEGMNRSKEQPVHGWFSQCCKLGELYESDDEYCGKARYLKLQEQQVGDIKPHPSEMLGA